MADDLQNFKRFMERRKTAAHAYVSGDPQPLNDIVAQASLATFFGPSGGHVTGTREVAARYERDAAVFEAGGETDLQILQMAASSSIAYWVGLQRATVKLRGEARKAHMELRITEIFRREGDEWKLVHRHAENLAEQKP